MKKILPTRKKGISALFVNVTTMTKTMDRWDISAMFKGREQSSFEHRLKIRTIQKVVARNTGLLVIKGVRSVTSLS
jgi:hypothetical protein